ncbi:putative cytoplasmic protein [Methanofollis liminatans DSM 4140]|jgi:putative transposon-encoded protein|uniref:Putative cytoplasmic protein n=1 Tax=Methanofollis liminatans DSM 4140 TaxID=28892 RepID=J1ASC9_9EURY|nr:putative cytoplasmic protein [Methanofollis liminatans DSM 4140]
MIMDLIEVSIRGYEVREKTVTKTGNSGHVMVPPSWIGKRVKIILLDPVEEE